MPKEKSHLVTQNLMSSVNWFLTAPNSPIKDRDDGKTWSEKAKEDLYNLINRVRTDFPESARRGVEFEKTVYKYANAEKIPSSASKEFRKVCEEVKGFQFYQKGNKTIEVDGKEVFLYAKYDAIIPHGENKFIKDLKTTGLGKYSFGKYLKGVQHKMYAYISEIPVFEYVIAEWEEYPKIHEIHKERYVVKDFNSLERELIEKIQETFSVLKDVGLWEAYRETYCMY